LASIGIASGLMERLGLSAGTGLAIIEQTIRYKTPVLFGDTIRLELVVSEIRPHAVKPQGKVTFDYQIIKGDDEVAIEGEWRWLFASRAVTEGDG
ncbi:MAG: acyl-CoA thioesterase, partial [Novosphingobium sp.]